MSTDLKEFSLDSLPSKIEENIEPKTEEGEDGEGKKELDLGPSILPLSIEELTSFVKANERVVALCGSPRRGFVQKTIDQWKEVSKYYPSISFVYLDQPNEVQGYKVIGFPTILTFFYGHLLHKKWERPSGINGVGLQLHLDSLLPEKEENVKVEEGSGILSTLGSIFTFW